MENMDHYAGKGRQQHELTMAVQSSAMTGHNLLLTAHTPDLGACWMCGPLFCPEAVKECLQIPSTWQPQGLNMIGYPADSRDKSRRQVSDLTLFIS